MNTLLLSITVMASIAAALGIMLSVAYNKLKVKQSPQIAKVSQMLPGVNCGACGYPNCNEFAKALVEDEAEIEKCRITARNEELVGRIKQTLSKDEKKA